MGWSGAEIFTQLEVVLPDRVVLHSDLAASTKPPRQTKKVTASSNPAPKKPAVMKPAAKQLPKKRGTAKEGPMTPKLPPKRTDVLLPGPHEEVSSESSDTDTPNPGLIDDTGPAASRHSNAPRASVSSPPRPTKANAATTPPHGAQFVAGPVPARGLRGVGDRHGPRGRRG
ncbi:hypothetical protein PF010_g17083 [Phytophthora fragariae]|uniref:Uncharacterized protein n=1 Tax=Phytophthora fragariae TaxID=53985 RepID=A0A6G0NI80_9STRA|nr:hypothetical protein PF010_g17083 [Phytophthora fragariae]KAE9209401.1 hypothetical protein PF004_g16470 [Phytophthora fragariae]